MGFFTFHQRSRERLILVTQAGVGAESAPTPAEPSEKGPVAETEEALEQEEDSQGDRVVGLVLFCFDFAFGFPVVVFLGFSLVELQFALHQKHTQTPMAQMPKPSGF